MKELTSLGEKNQNTLLFKPSKVLFDCSITQRISIILLEKGTHGIDWNSGFYHYSFINEHFHASEFVLPNWQVFVERRNEVDFNSKYMGNVRDLNELGCQPKNEIHNSFWCLVPIATESNPWNLKRSFGILVKQSSRHFIMGSKNPDFETQPEAIHMNVKLTAFLSVCMLQQQTVLF